MLTRRSAIACFAATAVSPYAFIDDSAGLAYTLRALESRSKGRLGIAVQLPSGKYAQLRGNERFPMCSTFKFLAAALVLERVDQGKEHLNRTISYSKADLVPYSPATEKQASMSMTVGELCKAALTLSDNTAANLLLASFGGPPAITAFARSIGDQTTRLDRNETSLNDATPGDPRVTTTPNAMLRNLESILFKNVLRAESRQQLTTWMLANTKGDAKFRAGLASGWKVADKTGAGDHGTNNDIGVLWTPAGKPILITSYLTGTTLSTDEANAIHAEVARAVAASYQA